MTIRTIIVDDEAPARRRARRLLLAAPDITVVADCGDGDAALATIRRQRPDLILLDVQMPERDGFEVVKALAPDDLPAIIFVTAHDRYALQAFDVHAVDYLLKPVTADRLQRALQRVRERLASRQPDRALAELAASLRHPPAYLSRVAVPERGRSVIVDLADVAWIEAADNYVRLHVERREYLLRETLARLETRLDPARFVRIHRSVLVALDRIATVRPLSHGDADVQLRDGTRLTASRTWRGRLMLAVGGARDR